LRNKTCQDKVYTSRINFGSSKSGTNYARRIQLKNQILGSCRIKHVRINYARSELIMAPLEVEPNIQV